LVDVGNGLINDRVLLMALGLLPLAARRLARQRP
jgi:hypothetical protein